MPDQDSKPTGGWSEWATYVLMTLEKLEEALEKAIERIVCLEKQMAVILEWRRVQGEPTAAKTEEIEDRQVDLRIEVARLAVKVVGVGAIAAMVLWIAKLMGWL